MQSLSGSRSKASKSLSLWFMTLTNACFPPWQYQSIIHTSAHGHEMKRSTTYGTILPIYILQHWWLCERASHDNENNGSKLHLQIFSFEPGIVQQAGRIILLECSAEVGLTRRREIDRRVIKMKRIIPWEFGLNSFLSFSCGSRRKSDHKNLLIKNKFVCREWSSRRRSYM